ncbi:hypothetical protein ACFC0C_21840 [Streptomyces sp. NPDC056178]|uniref:hypothetical protein n=1 Tax=unclassified Streptomyces TaxID=2593676 RepID=UPI0035DF281A
MGLPAPADRLTEKDEAAALAKVRKAMDQAADAYAAARQEAEQHGLTGRRLHHDEQVRARIAASLS